MGKARSSSGTSNTVPIWISEVATAAELWILVLSGLESLRSIHKNKKVQTPGKWSINYTSVVFMIHIIYTTIIWPLSVFTIYCQNDMWFK